MDLWASSTVLLCTLSAVLGDDAFTLMDTKGKVDIEAIKSISTTKQLFKIKEMRNPNATVDWKYAVLARDVPDAEAHVASLEALGFVGTTKTYVIKPAPYLQLVLMNLAMRAAKIVGTIFGTLPKRPLKPFTPAWGKCSDITVDTEGGHDFFGMSMQSYGDEAALKKYGKLIMTKVFPALDVSFAYMGTPEGYDNFNIQSYGSKKTFCEWAMSALAAEAGADYFKAIKAYDVFTAVEL